MYASFADSDKYHIMLPDRPYTHCGRQAPRRPWVAFSNEPPTKHALCQHCEESNAGGALRHGIGGLWEREAL
jgi:hypothetical protein